MAKSHAISCRLSKVHSVEPTPSRFFFWTHYIHSLLSWVLWYDRISDTVLVVNYFVCRAFLKSRSLQSLDLFLSIVLLLLFVPLCSSCPFKKIIFLLFITDTSRHVINASEMYPVPDTLEYANRTYNLIRGNFTWSAALKTCMANGAELVSIADQYHQAFLTVIVNRLGYNHWIGLFTADVRNGFIVYVIFFFISKLISCIIH